MVAAAAQQYRFQIFDHEQDLNNTQVQDIAFDQQGFLWAATNNGLFRFLGSRFEQYGSAQGMLERNLLAVYVDPQGRVWAGGTGNLYLLKGGRFEQAAQRPIRVDSGQLMLGLDKDHLLLIEKDQLLTLTLDATGTVVGSAPFFTTAQLAALPALNRLNSLTMAKDGRLWLGCATGLCSVKDGVVQFWGPEAGVKPEDWRRLHVTRSNQSLWAYSNSAMVELKNGTPRFISHSPLATAPPDDFLWAALAEDRYGRMLVTSPGGLIRRTTSSWEAIDSSRAYPRIFRATSLGIRPQWRSLDRHCGRHNSLDRLRALGDLDRGSAVAGFPHLVAW